MPSLEGFLESLEMQMDIEEVGPQNLPRAAELTQRTNQFNLTTRRYTQDELRDYLARPGHEGFVFVFATGSGITASSARARRTPRGDAGDRHAAVVAGS